MYAEHDHNPGQDTRGSCRVTPADRVSNNERVQSRIISMAEEKISVYVSAEPDWKDLSEVVGKLRDKGFSVFGSNMQSNEKSSARALNAHYFVWISSNQFMGGTRLEELQAAVEREAKEGRPRVLTLELGFLEFPGINTVRIATHI